MISDKRILICISGSISAYKAYDIVRILQRKKAKLKCALTTAGKHFVSEVTLQGLLQEEIHTDLFGSYQDKKAIHIHLAEWADIVAIIPASANILARVAQGMADDIVTSVILATKAPIVVVPAMHTNMWTNVATQQNVNTLKERGHIFVGPVAGALSDGSEGVGHIASCDEIIEVLETINRK